MSSNPTESVTNSSSIPAHASNTTVGGDEANRANTTEAQASEQNDPENPYEKAKRAKTSEVWNHFQVLQTESGAKKMNQCRYCKKGYPPYSSGATTTMARHLLVCPLKPSTLLEKGQKQLSLSNNS
ncbi:unnamed protein product [Linum trigynum]|uniref:BED-type domain-containing protein n=1 Tax=Linum trigynum TaxID=586398 RepID=A0AAV2EQD9_9ROSI